MVPSQFLQPIIVAPLPIPPRVAAYVPPHRNSAPVIRLTVIPATTTPEIDPILDKIMFPSASLDKVKQMQKWRQQVVVGGDGGALVTMIFTKAKKVTGQLQMDRKFYHEIESMDYSKGIQWMVICIEGMVQTRGALEDQKKWRSALVWAISMTHLHNDVMRRRLAAPAPINMVIKDHRKMMSLTVLNAWAMIQWMGYWDAISQARLMNLRGVNLGGRPVDADSFLYKDYIKFEKLKQHLISQGKQMLARGGDPRA